MHQGGRALSRTVSVAIVVIVVLVLVAGGYLAIYRNTNTSTSQSQATSSSQSNSITSSSSVSLSASSSLFNTTSSSKSTASVSSSSSSTAAKSGGLSSFIWETSNTLFYPDPPISTNTYDLGIEENVYEPLLWFNGSSSTEIIPWLAENYSISSDGKTITFTLRNNIHFADGEPLNSSAVYFSLNRILIEDGSTPVSHGTGPDWIVQQLLNTSLSSALSGQKQSYSPEWVYQVLAQGFVQITGPLTFDIHIQHPNAAFPVLIGASWAFILAPYFVMQHDLAIWNDSSNGYTLPYPVLSGNETNQIYEYFLDEAATCNAGVTPSGCGTTYLEAKAPNSGTSMAGTGPYTITKVDRSTNEIVLQARGDYWGGPYQFMGGNKIAPQIQTVDYRYVPELTTREIDLQNAVKSGQAMTIDVSNDHLYDFADRSSWLQGNNLTSIFQGISLYGPFIPYIVSYETFDTNVTNPQTGRPYSFQPFADIRFRQAFADSVNMTEINTDINNKMGQVAINAIPPGLPPAGSFNASVTPHYSYNPDAVQQLLLDAMQHPLTKFTFENGTAAQPGTFNNTFGCATLNTHGTCDHPISQSLTLYYYVGTTYADEQILTQIASVVNNISTTYNMGLTVNVAPVPLGPYITDGLSGYYYMWAAFTQDDYPWSLDFLGPLYAPGQAFTAPDGWNLTQMGSIYKSALNAGASNDIASLVQYGYQMNLLANQEVMYLWTLYPANFLVLTSNVHGYYYNPSLWGIYFASLYG